MTVQNFDDRYEEESMIGDKVVKALGLEPLMYSYPETDKPDPDGCRPPAGEIFYSPIKICVAEFLDGMAADSDVEEALSKVAIKGKCKFRWPNGYWTQKINNLVTVTDPTWADVFMIANKAYLDGGCPDHCFLENLYFDEKSKAYGFFFGS